ncbi:ASCH domain-containing protein [uncultured Desulfovibrio sp.]|uniref:ASCH domain-containing protein n=1 Tax=uncultured Desulfovibrio sp. TaxID=167968 RepID=UPI0026380188|nr:ASCH domain-containing protein [uncultured Desulfovibrio sp.]
MLYPVITIRQPWAALIVSGIKDVENRNWRLPDKYRNCTVLVHASAKPRFSNANADRELLARGHKNLASAFPRLFHDINMTGHIIGAVWFKGCDLAGLNPTSTWCDIESTFWWMIEKGMPIHPIPAKGKLRFWEFNYPHSIVWPQEARK